MTNEDTKDTEAFAFALRYPAENGLNLGANQISDISALSPLTNLECLALEDNQISDIAPLVSNVGLNDGDGIDLRDNPLSPESLRTYIPQLQARGVEVLFTVPEVCGDQDGDGAVTILDAIIDLQIITGAVEPTPLQLILSDVDGDAEITVLDVVRVLQHLVGISHITDCGPPAEQ